MGTDNNLQKARILIAIFMVCLIISGVTAFPLEWQLNLVKEHLVPLFGKESGISFWILKVHEGLSETNKAYPFLAYGTDWLAFAHVVIATAFIGPLKDPVKNIWVLEFGMIACLMVFPLAFIAGAVREIPLYWQFIDCSFGVIGFIPLWLARSYIKKVELE